jgi:hypothetical protein
MQRADAVVRPTVEPELRRAIARIIAKRSMG